MGWKLSAIFINSTKQIDETVLFQNLGFLNVSPMASRTFEEALNPDDGELYIGTYKGSTIICVPALPYVFLDESLYREEAVLIKTFPNAEIAALSLQSVVNYYGFTLLENGIKVRAKGGSSEDGVIIDYGTPLKEEQELLNKSKVNSDGERVYILDDYPDEELTEDQLGEGFVFNIAKRFIGEPLDAAEELLFETNFRGYSFSNTAENSYETEKIKKRTKWIKYLIYIALFFIFRFAIKYFLD